MSEDISRRKMFSLLGFGAALGFTLSGVLEPLEAEAQEAAPAPAAPAATGTHGMQRRSARRTSRHQRRHTRRTGQPAANRGGLYEAWTFVSRTLTDEESIGFPRPFV
jgi:hypothetical protein